MPPEGEAVQNSPLRQRLVGWLLAVLRHLPATLGYMLADAIALLVWVLASARERSAGRGADRNLRIAYRDELTAGGRRRLRWAWARHMCWLGVDLLRMPKIREDNLSRFVDLADWRRVDEQYRLGKGVICVTGHIGVPELLGHVASLQGIPTVGVFSPSAPPIEAALTAIRSSGGQRVLSNQGAIWPLKKALDRGAAIGLAADENTRKNPVFAPFLGTLAATSATPALLHLTSGAPIVVATIHRVGRLRYRLHVWDVITCASPGDRQTDLKAITREMNTALSRAIRAYPAQWFWSARRFRTRPDGEVAGSDGLPPTQTE